jgi:S1-C subfamily serine protease
MIVSSSVDFFEVIVSEPYVLHTRRDPSQMSAFCRPVAFAISGLIAVTVVETSGPNAVCQSASAQVITIGEPTTGLNSLGGPAAITWISKSPIGMDLTSALQGRTSVGSVLAGGTAATSGLQQGDVLLQVGEYQAPSPEQVAADIQNAWAAGKSAIDLIVSRSGRQFYVVLSLRP